MAIGNPITLTNNVATKTISVTATADQTLFMVTGGYRINQLAVFRNGVRLADGADFTARDGSSVTLLTPANLGDNLEFQVFDDFRVADAIASAAASQTIDGDLTVTGNLLGASIGIGTGTASTNLGFNGFSYLGAPFGATVNFVVTVAAKTAAHRYNGSGSSNGYLIDGVESPFLTLTPGRTYRFTLSSGDMTSHPFRFYLEADKTTAYTTNVTSTATYTEIVVTDSTPQVLHYQCSAHGYMGNAVQTNSNIASVATNASGLTGTPDIAIRNITGVAATFTGVVTYEDVTNIDSVGIITARTGVRVNAGGLVVTAGVSTLAADLSIADKIIHTGDTNTAIRFPAADTFTVETGGVERTRVTSGGDIGIGNVTSPSNNIEIRTDANDEGILLKSTGSTSNALDFDANRSGAENALASIRGKWNGTTVAQVTFLAGSDTTNKDDGVITFGTESAASNGNANATERLRITSAGAVLINSTSAATSDTFLELKNTASSTELNIISNNASGSVVNMGDTDAYNRGRIKYNNANNSFTFRTDGTDRLTIDSSGAITITAVPGTNNNASQAVLFQTSAGVIDGGSGLTYNPAEDSFSVNGLNITAQTIRSAGANQLTLTTANGNTQSDIRINQSSITILGGSATRLNVFATGVKLGPGALIENGLYDSGSGLTGDYNHDLATYGNVHYSGSNAAGAFTYNLRVNGSVSLNSVMAAGDTISFTLMHESNNTSYYMTAFKIDGTTQSVKYAGGSAPSEATGSGIDVYSFSIMKLSSANFKVFGTFTNHA
jgi:hypothetical protein